MDESNYRPTWVVITMATSCPYMYVGSDYTAMSNVSIQFPPTGRAIISVPIVNDDTVEMTERFIGSLTITDPRVRIQRSMAQVDITDSDGIVIPVHLSS